MNRQLPPAISAPVRRLWPRHRWLLLGLWLLVQAAFLLKFHGPHYANDSARYLGYATNLAQHGYYRLEPTEASLADDFQYVHNQRYILYPWYQSVWLRLHAG